MQAGRRRSNPSPESLRPQDRTGETPLESDHRGDAAVGPPTGKALVPARVNLSGARAPGTDRGGGRIRPARATPEATVTVSPSVRHTDTQHAESLAALEHGVPFAERHIGPRPGELATMLEAIGAGSLDELAAAAVPASIRDTEPVASTLPPAATETEVLAELRGLAADNTVTVPMIGLGYHGTITPPVVRRHVLENPAWYTAYTPYQPEISQGRLEALLTFQTTVADLTGLPVAGASLLDESTAAAEAMTLLRRANRSTSPRFLVDADTLPQTLAVLRTRAEPLGHRAGAVRPGGRAPRRRRLRRAAVLPRRVRGRPRPAAADRRGPRAGRAGGRGRRPAGPDAAHGAGRAGRGRRGGHHPALRGAARLRRPARGLPLGAGRTGPSAARAGSSACPTTPTAARRSGSPCRPASSTSGARRPRPTSARPRCCWPSSRPATPSTTGPTGSPASRAAPTAWPRCSRPACARAASTSWARPSSTRSGCACRAGPRPSPMPRTPPGSRCTASTTTRWASPAPSSRPPPTSRRSGRRSASQADATALDADTADALPAALLRTSEYLTHPVFHEHRSETSLMRWLRRLADADMALDRTMIPLGSCTMKLNAVAEMEPITWPGVRRPAPVRAGGGRGGHAAS